MQAKKQELERYSTSVNEILKLDTVKNSCMHMKVGFLGSSWASIFYGWGNLICLYYFNIISREFFLAATVGLYAWIGVAFWRDTKVYGYDSPLASMKELLSGS
ncbi:Maltose excess protein 1, chloroplastic [Vitis vinifera]|uniref:Maltose excess protein 1, chloroplastic n=1 Tax=Vitis vinifera TaxID=29760 RepID=A0A438G4Q3_VITVI|nr:Maltose excess protein 1, chloroplastic [Vitis vinifera]